MLQSLAGQGRPVAGIHRLREYLHNPVAHLWLDPPIRGTSAQLVHHYGIAFGLHALEQLPHPPLAHLHLLGGPLLRDLLALGLLQPIQPVSFLLRQCHEFLSHPSRLSIGTLYVALIGTSHVALTRRDRQLDNPATGA